MLIVPSAAWAKKGEVASNPDGTKKASKKKKSDRVLRLPSYFNRCGAASLVRERVLNRLLAKVSTLSPSHVCFCYVFMNPLSTYRVH